MGKLFDAVREGVTAKAAAQAYGLEFGRNGRACCPWHSDRHPDLAFYENGARCYCHACHNGGDAIALTAQVFGLSPLDAARKLNADFRLCVDESSQMPTIETSRAQRYRDVKVWGMHRFNKLCEVESQARQWLEQNPRADWDNTTFCRVLKALALVQDELEVLQTASPEDISALKEGVDARVSVRNR